MRNSPPGKLFRLSASAIPPARSRSSPAPICLRDGARDGVAAALREHARKRGLFGPDPGPTFDRRCGDLVVYHPEKRIDHGGVDVADKIEMHGGRTPREMLVPFAAARLSTLRDD